MAIIIFRLELLSHRLPKSTVQDRLFGDSQGSLGGSRPREAMALDLQILITLCVLSSEPHSSLLRKGGQGEGTWTLTVQIEAKS